MNDYEDESPNPLMTRWSGAVPIMGSIFAASTAVSLLTYWFVLS